jgi:Resolvase, N terminal domain
MQSYTRNKSEVRGSYFLKGELLESRIHRPPRSQRFYSGIPLSLQNLALQQDAFAEAGCGKIFTERLSGAVTDRPALRKALEFARSGNTLMANPDIPVIHIAQRLNVSLATLYRYVSAARTPNTPGV